MGSGDVFLASTVGAGEESSSGGNVMLTTCDEPIRPLRKKGGCRAIAMRRAGKRLLSHLLVTLM